MEASRSSAAGELVSWPPPSRPRVLRGAGRGHHGPMQRDYMDVGDGRRTGVLVSPLRLLRDEQRGPDAEAVTKREKGEHNAHEPHRSGVRRRGPEVAML